ncbi:hypothetical protein QEZ54_10835 [Catellatospora sp. KI3]|uniref:hypothetical protein n=1 Tax=Catellatospora sp. KI3 TaxID=3041620 RepID=UPI0024828C25|nr:hypothetical protein [Catellatospora sp. KI3]MDI1461466.1 hypothetical protein [Catellatospora sp. KI3]
MPRVTDNEDGTQTLSIDSTELAPIKKIIDEYLPELKKVADLAGKPEVKETVAFFKRALT